MTRLSWFAFWLCAVLGATPAAGAVFTPTIKTDPPISGSGISVNTSTGVITGGTGNGQISLRSAVQAANQNSGSTINLGSGTYALTIPPVMSGTVGSGNFHKAAYDNGTGLNLTGSLDIDASVTINGAGQAATIIDATGMGDRVMTINPYVVNTDLSVIQTNFTVTLQNLTVAHGNNPSDDGVNGYSAGGGIWWECAWVHGSLEVGSLVLTSVTLDHNATAHGGGAGGVVLFNGGAVTITGSSFTNNSVTGAGQGGGGAIAVTNSQTTASTSIVNTLSITNSTFTGNTCQSTSGGAIEVVGGTNAYHVDIHSSTFQSNSAAYGGAIQGTEPLAHFVIDQGTQITGNSATTGAGGGVFVDSNISIAAGTVITGNSAALYGGGISIGSGSTVTLSDISNNTAGTTAGGIYFFSGGDASLGLSMPSVSFSRIVGNTATLGANQIDGADVPNSLVDNWLGANLPGPNDIGFNNAVPISAIGPQSGGAGSPVTATTSRPHGFFAGQMVGIEGVANGAYGGNIGVCGTTTPFPGITNVTATTFQYCGAATNPQPASSGGYVNQAWQVQTAQESGNTVTLTGVHTPQGFGDAGDSNMRPMESGDLVHVWGISNAGYNGVYVVTGFNATAHTLTYTAPTSGLPTLNNLDNGSQIGNAIAMPKNIVTTSESGSTVTINTNGAHGLAVGNVVLIGGVGVAGYNGVFIVTSVASTSFTYTNTTSGLASSTTGSFAKLEDSGLQWNLSAAPNLIRIGDTSTLTGSFLTDSAGNSVSTANLAREVGKPVTWASGSLGTLSGQQTTVQSGGTATATFTSTAGGLDHPTAQVDSQTATTLVTVLFPPQISKSFSATHIADNGVATLTFTITNQNTTHGLNGLAFTDNLPAGLKVAAAPNASTTCTGGAVSATAGSGTISLSGGTLSFNAAGTLTCTVSVDVRGAVDGVQNNVTGSVTATDLGGMTGNTGSASITVINPPTIAKSFTPNSIPFGATSTLTLTVSSSNVNETLNGVAFTDNLPSGMTVASPSNLNNTCGGSATTPTTSRVALSGVTLAAGATCQVTLTVVATPVGTYNNSVSITSTDFGGLTGNTANASLAVTKANTTTAIASSSNPSAFGKPVTFTATVTDSSAGSTAVPTGTVQFVVDGVNFGSPVALTAASSTSATATSQATATLGVNASPHTVTANYVNADGNFNNSSGTLTGGQTITPASTATAVASSINPSTFGQSVKFTATVTDTAAGSSAVPTGAVQFVVDGANFGTPVTLVSGSATSASTTTLSASGSPHTVTANFVNADGNFSNSTGTLTGGQNVAPASTSTGVTSSQNPSVINQSVTFTATITNSSTAAVPTGSVQFVVDGANFGSPVALAAGANTAQSQATTTLSVAGSPHSVTANYSNADGNFNNSSGSLVGGQTVTKAITTTAISTSAGTIALGDTVTFTATVAAGSNTAQGIVTFFDGATPIGSATLNGVAGNDQAAFTTSLLSATGSPHAIKATFEDTASFAGSTSATIGETVNPRTSATGVVVNPTAVVVQQASTATVTVTDSGSVPPGAADTFASTGAPASGRTGFTATLFGDGLALVAGGTDANNNVLNGAEVYNVSGASFTSVGNLNTARTGAVAVLLPNGKVLVAGGSSDGTANGALKTAELFDPNTGTFTATSHAMNAARLGATAVLLKNGKVLLAGGIDSGGVLNTAELYDATADTFTATGNLNAARSGASATLLGSGKVLLAGGSSDGTANGALNSAEVFDPAGNAGAGTFAAVAGTNASLGVARWQPEAALLLSGKVLVAGGVNSGGALTSADLYDPVADSFTASGEQMSQARAGGTAVALPSGMVLLAGGTTSQAVDLYDEDSDQFNMTGSLQQSDAGLQSVLLNNGQVLVVGLTTSATPASDAELYAPSFNPLGTVVVTSSEGTDAITGACVLTPSTSTASTCTATVTPANVATSPHTITGTYPADGVHASSSNTASLILNKTDTSTSVTSATNPSVFGQSVTFTATVASLGSGTPSGTVTFLDGGNIIGSGSLGAGTATFTTSALAAGSHTITAHYGGDGNFNTSDGSMTGNPQVVTSANSTTTATSTANPSVFGQSVTLTATVSAVLPGNGIPTGTVTFSDAGSPIGSGSLVGGTATFTTSALAVGSHTITIHYDGDGNFNVSDGALSGNPQVVNKSDSTTNVTSVPKPSVFGQSVTFTATVSAAAPGSGTPTGTVVFLEGSTPLGAGTLSGGVATFATSALPAGNHTITTTYAGDGNFNGSAGSLSGNPQGVAPASTATALVSSVNPSQYGQPVSFTATVTDNAAGSTAVPTGAVQFVVDGVSFGSPVALANAGSTSGSATSSATSTLSVSGSPHTVSAVYVNADGNFNNSSANLAAGQTITVASTSTAVASSSNPSVFGQSVTFTATVSDPASIAAPTGAVQFVVDGVNFGAPVSLAAAGASSSTATSSATSSLSIVGSPHSVTANYVNADGNFSNSSGASSQVVDKDAAVAVTQSTPPGPITAGGAVQVTATVSAAAPGAGTPTGSVTFFDGGATIGTVSLSGGTASISTAALAAGNHSLTSSYSGDAFFNSTTSPPTILSVTPATRTITATAGANGSITPSTQYVVDGNIASFVVTPQNGYVATMSTTCPEGLGTLKNNVYTSLPISQDCSVAATFTSASAAATLTLTLSDNRSYVHYGAFMSYVVTLSNSSGSDVTGLTISGTEISPASDLDPANGHWQCFAIAADCLQTGTGSFFDGNVTVPANTSIAWVVSVPSRANPPDGYATYQVTVSGITPALVQSDTDVFVIFRDGFDVANGDGTGSSMPSGVSAAEYWDGSALSLPPMASASGVIEIVLDAKASDQSGFRIERFDTGSQDWLRVVTFDPQGEEQAGSWVAFSPNTPLWLGAACVQGKCEVMLVGGAAKIDVPIAASASWQVRVASASK